MGAGPGFEDAYVLRSIHNQTGTWRRNDVVLTLMRRNYDASTSVRRHSDVIYIILSSFLTS